MTKGKMLPGYSEAILLDPRDASPYSHRGLVFGRLGDCDKVISGFDAAVGLNPRHAAAFSNRGFAHRRS
jgi:hypothetical protein